MVALVKLAAADLLAAGQHRLALADADRCRAALGIDPLDGSGDDLAELALEFQQALSLFAGTDALTNDVARCGDRDPAELLGIERDLCDVADGDLLSFQRLFGVLQADLIAGIEHLVDDGLFYLYIK